MNAVETMEETVRTFRIELPVVLHVFAESEEDARARVKWLFEELTGFGTNLDRAEFLDVGEAPKPIDWGGVQSKGDVARDNPLLRGLTLGIIWTRPQEGSPHGFGTASPGRSAGTSRPITSGSSSSQAVSPTTGA